LICIIYGVVGSPGMAGYLSKIVSGAATLYLSNNKYTASIATIHKIYSNILATNIINFNGYFYNIVYMEKRFKMQTFFI